MAELLAPRGRLVCLEWPLIKDTAARGPPWGLTPEIYQAHLARPDQDVAYGVDGNIDADSVRRIAAEGGTSGLRRLAREKPSTTHATGMTEAGEVHDRVSIWGFDIPTNAS
jgi:methyl halide transferase